MRRNQLLAFVAVLVIAAIPTVRFLTKDRDVIASTPSAYTGQTVPLPVEPKMLMCVDEIVYDQDSAIARFGATARPGKPAPTLEVNAAGNHASDGYRVQTTVPGGWQGGPRTLDVPLTPAPRSLYGTLCVRNV